MADALQTLRAAAEGLMYPSEQDSRWTAFRWKGEQWTDARSAVLADCGYGENDPQPPIREESVAAFFDWLASGSAGDGHERLRQAIDTILKNPTVLHVGEIEVAVYVIGKTDDDRWAGVWTTAVET